MDNNEGEGKSNYFSGEIIRDISCEEQEVQVIQ